MTVVLKRREGRAGRGEGSKAKQASCMKTKGRNQTAESGRQEYPGILVTTRCGRDKEVSLEPSEDCVPDNHLTLASRLGFIEPGPQTAAVLVCVFVIVFLEK